MIRSLKNDNLTAEIYDTRDEMGYFAAKDIEKCIKKILESKDEVNMIFAAAPSQNDVLYHLCESCSIEWEKINAFHMDEYIELPKGAPQGFANFLMEKIFSKKPFKSVNLIDYSATEPEKEIERYSKLLLKNPVDIVVLGIGENGHIAFNDPHVADFNDKALVKKVDLDEVCRKQQVNDGCFEKIDDVPKFALTLTIPALTAASHMFCIVPCFTKAEAVKNTMEGEISILCPASILRKHESAKLYLDKDSAKMLSK